MSLSPKTKKWLSKYANISLKDKNVLITGSNSGIGFKTAETLAYLGANIILACRNAQRATDAKNKLISEYPNSNVSIMELDVANLSSIDSFCNNIIEQKMDIDVFVNNAGVFHKPNEKTKDGFELVIGTDYIGVYYLSEKILPYFKTLSHEVIYVNTISIIHKIANIDYTDFYFDKNYNNFQVYARAKLCLAKYTYYMAQKYSNSNIKIYMNHPGITMTPLGVNGYGSIIKKLSNTFSGIFNSNEKSSLSIAYILANNFKVGSIVGPNKLFGGWGYPKLNSTKNKVIVGAEELINFTNQEISNQRVL